MINPEKRLPGNSGNSEGAHSNEIDFFANGKVRMVGYRVYEGAPIANKG